MILLQSVQVNEFGIVAVLDNGIAPVNVIVDELSDTVGFDQISGTIFKNVRALVRHVIKALMQFAREI